VGPRRGTVEEGREVSGNPLQRERNHVIPRYKGDVPNPRGGVRGVIPYKASY